MNADSNDFRYVAFLSYRSIDRKIAQWLHRSLERYRVPRRLVGIIGDQGPVPARIAPVFRDRDEARASADIETTIANFLAQSKQLVVLCSPAAVEPGSWVSREIEIFRTLRPAAGIHAVLAYGEPSSSFPRAFLATHDGIVSHAPLAADLRPVKQGGDGRQRGLIKLIASILGVEFDDLWQREKRRRRFYLVLMLTVTIFGLAVGWDIERRIYSQRTAVIANAAQSAINSERFDQAMRLTVLARDLFPIHPLNSAIEPALRYSTDLNRLRSLIPPAKHAKPVYLARLSRDGTRLITVAGSTAYAWNATTGSDTPEASIDLHGPIISAELSPDGRTVLLASQDPKVGYLLWDAIDLKIKIRSSGTTVGFDIASFSPDGSRFLAVSRDGYISIRRTESGILALPEWKVAPNVRVAKFDRAGKRLVLGTSEGKTEIWNAKLGTKLSSFQHPKQAALAIADASFNSNGTQVVIATEGGIAQVWDVTGKAVTAPLKADGELARALFSPDDRFVLTAGPNNKAQIWSMKTQKAEPRTIRHENNGAIASIQFSSDGKYFLTGSSDGTAKLWDFTTGKAIGRPLRHAAGVSLANFSEDGKHIITATLDGEVRTWSTPSPLHPKLVLPHASEVRSASFNPEGSEVLSIDFEGRVRLCSATGSSECKELVKLNKPAQSISFINGGKDFLAVDGSGAYVASIAFGDEPKLRVTSATTVAISPNGKVLATAIDNQVEVRKVIDGTTVIPPLKLSAPVHSVAFDGDGLRIAISFGNKACSYDLSSERGQVCVKHSREVYSVKFTPDGQSIITGSRDGTAQIWSASNGRPLGTPMAHPPSETGSEAIRDVVISPNGRMVATRSDDHTGRIWNAHDGSPITPAMSHPDEVTLVSFSRDSKRVLTVSRTSVYIWDAASGKPIHGPLVHPSNISSAEFSPDGTGVLTASDDGLARLWLDAIPPAGDFASAKERACNSLHGNARRITKEDLAIASVFPQEVLGRDVCQSPRWPPGLVRRSSLDSGSRE